MKKLLIFLFIVLISFACEKDELIRISLDTVSGFVQKGPYQNGTSLEIYELTEDLDPTGKIFLSQILDNRGTFEVSNIDLSSQFVEIKSDWNDAENSRIFTSKKTGELDLEILLEGDSTGSETNIFVYENGSMEPTWSKTIAVN